MDIRNFEMNSTRLPSLSGILERVRRVEKKEEKSLIVVQAVPQKVVRIFFGKVYAWAEKRKQELVSEWKKSPNKPRFNLNKPYKPCSQKKAEYDKRSEQWLREAYKEAGLKQEDSEPEKGYEDLSFNFFLNPNK